MLINRLPSQRLGVAVSPRKSPSAAGRRSLTNSGQPREAEPYTVFTRSESCANESNALVKASSFSQIALKASWRLSQVIFDTGYASTQKINGM